MRNRSARSPLSTILLLAIIATVFFLPLPFIVLPAVFAHLFQALSRARPSRDSLVPFRASAPLLLRSPPV